jgi:hypothetical protein
MRPLFAIAIGLLAVAGASAQDVPPRFDIIYNSELYRQDTPQETLKSLLGAISRERYDYALAHLIDPADVNARLAANQTYFERMAAEQVGSTAAGRALDAPEFQRRVQDVGTRLNVRQLGDQLRSKLTDETDNVKDLKRFAREGQFQEAGETATATIKDVKDRALYFKKVGSRWFMENRKEDRPPAKE